MMRNNAGEQSRGKSRALLKTPCETFHPIFTFARDALMMDGLIPVELMNSIPSSSFIAQQEMVLLCQTWCDFAGCVSTPPLPKHPVWLCCEHLSFTSSSPARPPTSEEWELCLWSFELWCLACSGEPGSVSRVCLNRLLSASFSLLDLAWISANRPQTFSLSFSWPIEVMLPTKLLWEFGVISLEFEYVECFLKAYTSMVANLLFCQFNDHKPFSYPEKES